ncbi:NAD-dependent epimerase/dehydratase family protein [Telmatobacter bradus]|jgi:nucleoside-diphosphate-sugar epimerase|uniref:NAD-dependent epimerase/dehydratase family protein n=1 Tax=Telmatobacter bradus TaxID=474953 RepID=UPI003B43363B
MKIFVAGASGAIGKPLISRLVAEGHQVTGLTTSEAGATTLRAQGAEAILANALDSESLDDAVRTSMAEAVIDQLTSLPKNPADMPKRATGDAKLRLEGGGNLLRSAQKFGVKRYIQQSSAFFLTADHGLADEQSPLAVHASPGVAGSAKMFTELERRLTTAPIDSVILRYGFFYGPGTWYASDGGYAEIIRQNRYPIIGQGMAVWSWIHIGDAVEATVAALAFPSGVYNIVDDDPTAVKVWLPAFAASLGAPPPNTVTEEEARRVSGDDAVFYGTKLVGASNAKAKRVFGFAPRRLEWLRQEVVHER